MCSEDYAIVYQTGQKDEDRKTHSDYENSTYAVVSTVAYLIGVPKNIFENEHEPPQMETYERLDKLAPARIMRNLCVLRTAIERNFGKIFKAMREDLKNLHSLPDYIPQACLRQLREDGITVEKANTLPAQYIIDINRLICDRINNCKDLFPLWLKWDYIRQLFIMPGGQTEAGIRKAAGDYYANWNAYPYQTYINWEYGNQGNILYNDKKFVLLLYEAHQDYFEDMSKITDAGNLTKAGIYRFLDNNDRINVLVDCENSDPYKLYATLKNLDENALLSKINKIILFDDVHTTPAWKNLEKFTNLPIEHVLVKRVKENKSLVDLCLSNRISREYYENQINAVILLSSDSDYWAVISDMPELRFFVMVESEKCGPDLKNALINAGVSYCYIDDFCTGNSNEIKIVTVLEQVRQVLDQSFHMNVKTLLGEANRITRAGMSTGEMKQFYDRYIKKMRIVIAPDGEATIELGS